MVRCKFKHHTRKKHVNSARVKLDKWNKLYVQRNISYKLLLFPLCSSNETVENRGKENVSSQFTRKVFCYRCFKLPTWQIKEKEELFKVYHYTISSPSIFLVRQVWRKRTREAKNGRARTTISSRARSFFILYCLSRHDKTDKNSGFLKLIFWSILRVL